MEARLLLELLIETATELGMEVRRAPRSEGSSADPRVRSGFCRVAGNPWVILAADDPPEFQVQLLARVLRENAASELDARYLPPVVRTVIAGTTTA